LSFELNNGSPENDVHVDARLVIVPISILEGSLGCVVLRDLVLER
jgi:hypothetical protein